MPTDDAAKRVDDDAAPPVRRKRCIGGPMVAVLIGLPILYVLSIGPAARLQLKGYLPAGAFASFYAPIRWAGDNCESFRLAIGRYVGLWFPPPPDDPTPYTR